MAFNNNTVSLPTRIQESIIKPFEPCLIKTREVNKVKMSYVSGSTVIDKLNSAFDYMWDWHIDKVWIEQSVPFFNKHAQEKTDTFNGKTGAWEEQGPVAHVMGTLTVYFKDESSGEIRSISKTGLGSKCIIGKQSEQDSIYKAADTDALKKAASRLGIGNELYRTEDEQDLFITSSDPYAWTTERQEQYKNQLEYLNTIFAQTSETKSLKILQSFDITLKCLEDITPVNIEEFVEHVRKYLKEENSKSTNFEGIKSLKLV